MLFSFYLVDWGLQISKTRCMLNTADGNKDCQRNLLLKFKKRQWKMLDMHSITLPSESTSYTAYVVCMSLKGPIGEVEVSICDSFSPPLLQCSFPLISHFHSLPLFPRSPFPRGTLSLCWLSQIRGPGSLSLSLFSSISRSVGSAWLVLCPPPLCVSPLLKERKQRNGEKGEEK